MDFANLHYWIVLIAGITLIYVIRSIARLFYDSRLSPQLDKFGILAISLTVLGYADITTLLIFMGVSLIAYFGCSLIQKCNPKGEKFLLGAMVILLLMPLAYYKYRFFVCESILHKPISRPISGILIPIGISFYTFQVIGFVIDSIKHKHPVPKLIDYLNFISFLPQIVAGPIERRNHLLPQMQAFAFRANLQNIETGLRYLILGLFFKLCLGDNLALCRIWNAGTNPWAIWLNNLTFGLRIYFDFAGYGLSAYGLARMFGIKLIMNFLSPYTASNISEFWRRWHISLTSWFRDYIYFPMGGSRTRFWAFNLLVVFLISGLWHGASWNFLLWGGINGLALIVHKLFSGKFHFRMNRVAAFTLTSVFIFYSWLFFYETDLPTIVAQTQTLLTPSHYSLTNLRALASNFENEFVISVYMLALACGMVFLEYRAKRRNLSPYELLASTPALVIEIVLMTFLGAGTTNEFIYFSF